jgi:predicted transcriptional regulator
MKNLTRKEENIMQVIWDLENALVSDIISKLPEQDLPYTTISSIVRILEKKGFVDHRTFGKTHQYYPLISKEEYRKTQMKSMVQTYFDSSYKNVVSFFAENDEISPDDLKEILDLIENKKTKEDD